MADTSHRSDNSQASVYDRTEPGGTMSDLSRAVATKLKQDHIEDRHASPVQSDGSSTPNPGSNSLDIGNKSTCDLDEDERQWRAFLLTVPHAQRRSPTFLDACVARSAALWKRWEKGANEKALAACIDVLKELLDVLPRGRPQRAPWCRTLVIALRAQYGATGDRAALVEAMLLAEETLQLSCAENESQLRLYRSLADALCDSADEIGLVEQATDLYRAILLSYPSGHPDRAAACENLALSLETRFSNTGELTLIDEAIRHGREALSLRPPDHPDRVRSCTNLAQCLDVRCRRVQDSALRAEAMQLAREALAVLPPDHPDRAKVCSNMAQFLHTHFKQEGDPASLEEAIRLHRETILLRPLGHTLRAKSCANLALALTSQYNITGKHAILEEAIGFHREALASCSPSDPDRALICANLAGALSQQYNQVGERALLDETIELKRQALLLRPINHRDRAALCYTLAVSLRLRFLESKDSAVLNEAISFSQEALKLRPVGHPDRATSCLGLASLLGDYSSHTGERSWLDQAIALQREALALCPRKDSNRASMCRGLIPLLGKQLETYAAADVDKAAVDELFTLANEVLVCCPPGHPEYWRGPDFLATLAVTEPHRDSAAAIKYLRELLSASTYDDINLAVKCAMKTIDRLDMNALSTSQRRELLVLHEDALGLVALAASFAINPATQLQHVQNGRMLVSNAYMLAGSVAELPKGLELIEQSRGVLWSQTLHLRTPQLENVPIALADRLQALVRGMGLRSDQSVANHELQSSVDDTKYAQRRKIQDVIQEIRSLPGLETFMRGPNASTLMTAASRGFVVILVPSEIECHALVIVSPNVALVDIRIPDVSHKILQDLTFAGLTTQKRGAVLDEGERGMRVSRVSLSSHTRLAKLWRVIVKPVISRLGLIKAKGRNRPRIHWCPTGILSFVPLHAAGVYEGANQECCSDYVVSSYTPTLTALLRARLSQPSLPVERIQVVTITAEHAQDSNMIPLLYVREETQSIIEIVGRAGAAIKSDSSTSTKADVLTLFETANVVHLACHGVQHPTEPHKSRFCLTMGDLSVSELMDMDLKNAFVAFLSACETAKGNEQHADEVVHLAAAMLLSGFKSVVATMWAMNDEDGPHVARRFYEQLLEGGTVDADSVAYALDDAVRALRMRGVPPERWATFIHMGA